MNKGFIIIRGNRLVALTTTLDDAMHLASHDSKNHMTIYSLDTMKCVAELNAFKPLGSECEACGATP